MGMGLSSDLIAFGMPPDVADLYGHQALSSPAGAGVAAATATALTSNFNLLKPAGSATGFKLPATAYKAKKWFFFNDQATTAVIYPPTGGKINAGNSVSLAQNKAGIAWFLDDVNDLWAWIALA